MKKLPEIGQQVKVRKAALTLFPDVAVHNAAFIGLVGTVTEICIHAEFPVIVSFSETGREQGFHPSELAKSK